MQTKDMQKDFLDLLRNNYVVSANHITALFKVRNVEKFVQGVRDRTELDIYEGRGFSFEGDADETVYYMVSDIKPECPGLDGMTKLLDYKISDEILPSEATFEDIKDVEFHWGYYLMWVCPHTLYLNGKSDTVFKETEMCGQFHKVDLGDETLTTPRAVRCIKCGKEYRVNPKGR